ncbi:AGC/PDK1 protein kinase Ksg1 [Schizosaccharomyces japonicus yFS275]|uniref:non-specific serine/threonine protein kinase n=1 Tax=Schizosaccharomyces japonicus (strain yFS275 / FY16936) TaxID=402676 RepID=B6K2J7_SCHJY|nr:AGC/PDK1 protein kinase Ksg1 [Schizosaccharomyces japonicus yFS275]EEB07378.1 AGC/PDK1 protein kinase Ksg1 [Schizosaccharomyces japonicus yFS275]
MSKTHGSGIFSNDVSLDYVHKNDLKKEDTVTATESPKSPVLANDSSAHTVEVNSPSTPQVMISPAETTVKGPDFVRTPPSTHANPETPTAAAPDRPQQSLKKGVKDFKFGEILGEGSYSTVVTATDIVTHREYAIKIVDKRHVIKENKVKYVNIEKDALHRLSHHPGIIRLYFTFQDEYRLYFVLSLASNGELSDYIRKFTEPCAQFYAAQLLDVIDYIHENNIIHRDLKPENILLDENMRIKVIDFGSAKLNVVDTPIKADSEDGASKPDARKSFVGTAEYVSPEVLLDKYVCRASDIWAFGCILYQMFVGRPPFRAANEYQVFQNILHLRYEIPDDVPPSAAELIREILLLDPKERLTINEIREHPFFEGVTFGKPLWEVTPPRLKPSLYINLPNDNPALDPSTMLKPSDTPVEPSFNRENASPLSLTLSSNFASMSSLQLAEKSQNAAELAEFNNEWSVILQPGEAVCRAGIVNVLPLAGSSETEVHRFFSKIFRKRRRRLLLITTLGRCLFVSKNSDGEKSIKEEIPIQSVGLRIKPVPNSPNRWTVETPTKTWSLADPHCLASDWIECLTNASMISTAHANGSVSSFSRSVAR